MLIRALRFLQQLLHSFLFSFFVGGACILIGLNLVFKALRIVVTVMETRFCFLALKILLLHSVSLKCFLNECSRYTYPDVNMAIIIRMQTVLYILKLCECFQKNLACHKPFNVICNIYILLLILLVFTTKCLIKNR